MPVRPADGGSLIDRDGLDVRGHLGQLHVEDEGGVAWNDPEIGIVWPKMEGEYPGTASGEGYTVDGVPLKLSDRDLKWPGIKDAFKF